MASCDNKNSGNIRLFHYQGRDYTFLYDADKTKYKAKSNKTIYIGCFPEEAPADLQPKTNYCLKVINATNPSEEACAARRECYELIDFSGPHLRQILLRNDYAQKAAEELRQNNTLRKTITDCMVIEPYYYSTQKYFTDCYQYSVGSRLDMALQYAMGSDELSGSQNMIHQQPVMAHRDLKGGNGVAEVLPDGAIRIRLVDFATIWLYSFTNSGTQVRSNGTMQMPLSPENTCPEDVLPGHQISEKTDVYALGMLLGSLFMRHDGSYVNPNQLWLRSGKLWYDHNTEAVAKQLLRCKEIKPEPMCSWIEWDLKNKHNIQLTWEPMQNQEVACRIRKLFCAATRIDPVQRPTRKEFIRELESILELENSQLHQIQPVNIYLFNTANADRYMERYRQAAEAAFSMDREEAKQSLTPAPQALCIGYSSLRDCQLREQIEQLGSYPGSNEAELSYNISRLKTTQPEAQDNLLYGLLYAYRILHSNKQFGFAGKVYLFSPEVPTAEQMTPLYQGNQVCGLLEMCRQTLDVEAGQQTVFTAFAASAPQPSEAGWCIYKSIQSQSAAGPAKDQQKSTVAEYASLRYDISETAPYIKLPGGERAYIRIVKS